jgi:D-lactate dehydrogenase
MNKKIFVYNYRDFDEAYYFTKYEKEYPVELFHTNQTPTLENASLAKGCEALNIITTPIDRELMKVFADMGIKVIATRTIGYDHIDMKAARDYGIKVCNLSYSPECVADYALMLMLMTIRKVKAIMLRGDTYDFTLKGLLGRELPDLTVGVLGTGRIGEAVIRRLTGFGCKILAYDKYEKESVKKVAQYVDLDTIYKECDVLTLHMPANEDNFHLINKEAFEKMKDGVFVINTARGSLIDSYALMDAIESGKVGGCGLDVIEDEWGLYYNDLKYEILTNRELSILRGYKNVIVTHHMAFYSDNAIDDMVHNSIKGICLSLDGKENPWEVK